MPIRISVMDESISLPNTWFLRYSFNPAVSVGTEWVLKEKNNHDLHATGNLGFFYHKDWQSAVYLNSEIGYRYRLQRFFGTARFGLGYTHQFATKPVYSPVDGNFEQVTDYGGPAVMTSLAVGVGYRFGSQPYAPEVGLTLMQSFDVPFTIFSGAHQFVGVSFAFYPFNPNSSN